MGEKKNKNVINTDSLVIDENIMKYDDSVIQMSNVSRCEVAPMPEFEYPIWAIIGVIIGIFIMFKEMVLPGLLLIIVFGGILLYIANKNQQLGTYLIFELNSGKAIYFSCSSKEFLICAQKAVIDCFNNAASGYVINFLNCSINDSQIGDKNKMG